MRMRILAGLLLVSLASCFTGHSDGGAASGGTGGSGGVGGSGGAGGSGGVGGSGGAGGSSGSGGAGGSGGVGGSGGSGGDGGSGGAGGSDGCTPACGEARDCCDAHCVNLQNDPQNCGACAVSCEGATSFCSAGQCSEPPCSTTCGVGATCCGTACCAAGELCCDPQGPIDVGPSCLPPSEQGTCPTGCAPLCICADPDTPIATPSGTRAIASLAVGDLVYSVDHDAVVVVPIVRTNRTPVFDHHVLRVTLATGSALLMSPGHPTADGRRFEDLAAGATLDGVSVTSIELVPYRHDATYDILPASETGAYFAAGVLVGSTLAQ